jgi:hypothetical protein
MIISIMLAYLNSFELVCNTVCSLISEASLLRHVTMLSENANPRAKLGMPSCKSVDKCHGPTAVGERNTSTGDAATQVSGAELVNLRVANHVIFLEWTLLQ